MFILEKRLLVVKFSIICSESLHGDTDWRCCVQMSWNLSDGKSVKSCVIYLTKNFGCLSNCQNCVDGTKICQGQPPTFLSHCSRFHPNRSTFSGVIAERVRFCRIEYFHDRLSEPIITSSSAVADKPARRAAPRQTAKFLNSHVTITTPFC